MTAFINIICDKCGKSLLSTTCDFDDEVMKARKRYGWIFLPEENGERKCVCKECLKKTLDKKEKVNP